MEARPGHMLAPKDQTEAVLPAIRRVYNGQLIVCGGYDKQSANQALFERQVDAAAFGQLFIANPDLVERFKHDARLNVPDVNTFYTQGAAGYLDYPTLSAV
jgi:2,4-dienoyl-CoA reductase-like NADH-dependent reductase (Old Yellow Enzyme family)